MTRVIRPAILTWFAILSMVGTLLHLDGIDQRYYEEQNKLHRAIVWHTAPAPYQYRVLQPGLVHTLLKATRSAPRSERYRLVFLGGYGGLRFLAILTTLVAVFAALRRTWAEETAVLAATALAAFLPFTYRYYYYQPTSVMEMAFVGLGLLAICARTPAALAPLVAIGTLNRETTCFLPLAYFLYWWRALSLREWRWLGASVILWALVFIGLRLLWPAPSDLFDLRKHVSANLSFSRENLDVLVILSPALLLLFARERLPRSHARLASCAVPWLVLHFFASRWYEIRHWMPALIWFLPGLLVVLSGRRDQDEAGGTVVPRRPRTVEAQRNPPIGDVHG